MLYIYFIIWYHLLITFHSIQFHGVHWYYFIRYIIVDRVLSHYVHSDRVHYSEYHLLHLPFILPMVVQALLDAVFTVFPVGIYVSVRLRLIPHYSPDLSACAGRSYAVEPVHSIHYLRSTFWYWFGIPVVLRYRWWCLLIYVTSGSLHSSIHLHSIPDVHLLLIHWHYFLFGVVLTLLLMLVIHYLLIYICFKLHCTFHSIGTLLIVMSFIHYLFDRWQYYFIHLWCCCVDCCWWHYLFVDVQLLLFHWWYIGDYSLHCWLRLRWFRCTSTGYFRFDSLRWLRLLHLYIGNFICCWYLLTFCCCYCSSTLWCCCYFVDVSRQWCLPFVLLTTRHIYLLFHRRYLLLMLMLFVLMMTCCYLSMLLR